MEKKHLSQGSLPCMDALTLKAWGCMPVRTLRAGLKVQKGLLGLIAMTLLTGGCALLGPDFKTPEAPVSDRWIESDDPKLNSEELAVSAAWWTLFNDPVLNALIETAYRQNLPLRIAGLRILEARAQSGIARGSRFPQVQQARASSNMIQISENAPNAAPIDRFHYEHQLGFDAAWELDVWGRFRRGIESADAILSASIANYDDVLVSLTAEVARFYILIRTVEERLRIARQNVKIQKRSLKIADVRFRNGVVSELDVAQAKALLRDTQALIPALETGLRQAQNGLSILMGTPPRDLQDVLHGPAPIPQTPAEIVVGIPAELLRRRPDIRRAEMEAAAQSARIGIAKSDLYPRFSLSGSIGLASNSRGGSMTSNSGSLFDLDSLTYSVGPSFQWPILNYGRLTNNVRVQDALFQQLVVNYQNTVLEAAREVENGLVAFLRAQEQGKLLQESVEASRRSVDLSLVQYRDGVADYQRVLDSQRFLVQAQQRLTETRGDVVQNLIAVYKALGGGWQLRLDKNLVPEETQQTIDRRHPLGVSVDTLMAPTKRGGVSGNHNRRTITSIPR